MDEGGDIKFKIISSDISGIQRTKRIGLSKFYDVTSNAVTPEKQDEEKPDDYIDDGESCWHFSVFALLTLYQTSNESSFTACSRFVYSVRRAAGIHKVRRRHLSRSS